MEKTQLRSKTNYDLSGDIAKIKAVLAETTKDVKGRAGQILSNSIEDAREKSAELQATASTYIAAKPFKAVGAALLAGIIFGLLFRK